MNNLSNSFTDNELRGMITGNNPVSNAYRELLAYRESAKKPDGNSPVIPDGWALVPIEATPEMLNASWIHHSIHCPSAWRTMIAAAPKPE